MLMICLFFTKPEPEYAAYIKKTCCSIEVVSLRRNSEGAFHSNNLHFSYRRSKGGRPSAEPKTPWAVF